MRSRSSVTQNIENRIKRRRPVPLRENFTSSKRAKKTAEKTPPVKMHESATLLNALLYCPLYLAIIEIVIALDYPHLRSELAELG
jgi:hypothetical protein